MNTSEITDKLLKLKSKIEDAKERRAEAKGKRDTLMARLKEDHGCNTLEAAEKMLAKLEKETETEAKELERGIAELEKMMEGQQ